MAVSSATSYATFKTLAWNKLEALSGQQGVDLTKNVNDIGHGIDEVYKLYAETVPQTVAAKVALQGQDLRTAMEATFNNLGTRMVVLQDDGTWPQLNNVNMMTEFKKPMTANLSQDAQKATDCYLHVYPNQTIYGQNGNVTLPTARTNVVGQSWRIGVNATPTTMAAAVAKILGIMDAYNCIQHIKFTPPRFVSKSDAIILYMKKDNDYATVRNAVQTAMGDAAITLQPCVNLMWNEFADGMGEAAESPTDMASFGDYRSVLAFTAYYRMLTNPTMYQMTEQIFNTQVDKFFANFGIPLNAPHDQEAAIKYKSGMNGKMKLYATFMCINVEGNKNNKQQYMLPMVP